jgi:hypothetical protein
VGEVGKQDVAQEWIVWLADRHSRAHASNQFRALQQFFEWLAAEEAEDWHHFSHTSLA